MATYLPRRIASLGVIAKPIPCSGNAVHMHCISHNNCTVGSLYCLEFFKQYLQNDEWVYFDTRQAYKLRDKLSWEDEHVAELLMGLSTLDFQKIVEDCTVNDLPGYKSVHGDQYEIFWHLEDKVRKNGPVDGTLALSLKIAIVKDSLGYGCGVVTLHTSGY